MKDLIYSPKEKIPLFKLLCSEKGDRSVEYLNNRTACTERIKVSTLIIFLLEKEMVNGQEKEMIYSPKESIPIGKMFRDKSTGISYLEVKYKKKQEEICFSKYVSLLLET